MVKKQDRKQQENAAASKDSSKKMKKVNLDEFAHLNKRDFEDELEHREFSMFWDSLDIAKDWRNIFKILFIRYALILTHVHLRKHPDEIQ